MLVLDISFFVIMSYINIKADLIVNQTNAVIL